MESDRLSTYSRLLFDRGINAQIGRPSLNDLLFINTSFFNLFLPLLLTGLMRFLPQANHLVFGQLEGQDPIYSTLLIGMATVFNMLIYMRQTYFYEGRSDRSFTFKVVNQIAFVVPLGIWLLAISFNYPGAHIWSLLLCTILIILVLLSISTRSKHNPFKKVLQESKINRLIILWLVLYSLIFTFFLIRFDEIGGKDNLLTWVLMVILFTFAGTFIVNQIYQRRKRPRLSFRHSLVHNSTVNAIYLILVIVIGLRFFGDYTTLGNAFDVLILFFFFIRIVLFGLGVLVRYFANSKPIRFFNFKFGAFVFVCYLIGYSTRPVKGRDHYRLEVMPSSTTRLTMDEYVDRWLRNTAPDQPIYLISGQGGGSRAGCAFFTTMTLLDSILYKNTLAITTISGSSNGAGFYLGVKKAIPADRSFAQYITSSDTAIIQRIDSILYHKDYISNSLFKLLFTDRARSLFDDDSIDRSRNLAFINEEKTSFLQSTNYLKLDDINWLDSTWSSIYNTRADPTFPLFMPVSFNIESGIKAINSPVKLPTKDVHPTYSILESLGDDRDLRVNQSILTSQLFPFISASATIDGFHYLDGGIYDNLGYESLFDLYQFVAKKRDKQAASRPIILLSIINGNYEDHIKPDRIQSELKAVTSAMSQSLFSTHPLVNKMEGLSKLNKEKDRFFELKIFQQSLSRPKLNFFEHVINFLKYSPDKDKVIVSRYLTLNDIDQNIIQSAYREVERLKIDLNKFLNAPR
jgi:predicted patatin/cPLA2 family phospholipase